MQQLDAQQLAIDAKPEKVGWQAILFDFASGFHGFWTGDGPIDWNGFTFNSGGQVFEVSLPEMKATTESLQATIKLYANPDSGLTDTVLATIFNETYMYRPVRIYEVLQDPDTGVRSFLQSYQGLCHGIVQDLNEGFLEATLESHNYDFSNNCGAMANDAHHKQISADDKFMEYSAIAHTVPLHFGRPTPAPQANSNQVQTP
jgi:hypothetical protein